MLFYRIFPYVRNGKITQTNIKSLSLETVPQVEGSPLLVMSALSFVAVFFPFLHALYCLLLVGVPLTYGPTS